MSYNVRRKRKLDHGRPMSTDERQKFVTNGFSHGITEADRYGGSLSVEADDANLDGLNYLVGKSLTEINRKAYEGTAKAHEAGAPIVFGTDAGVYPHGVAPIQMPIMVREGMTPMEVIQAATSKAARYMDWADRVGSVEAGKLADLIAVQGDPLADIGVMQDVAVVIQGGLVFKMPEHD